MREVKIGNQTIKVGDGKEVGRELKAADLKPEQIVVIAPPGHPGVAVTMWVKEVDAEHSLVALYSGTLLMHVINFIQPDGSLVDDQGRAVRIFEYLGEP